MAWSGMVVAGASDWRCIGLAIASPTLQSASGHLLVPRIELESASSLRRATHNRGEASIGPQSNYQRSSRGPKAAPTRAETAIPAVYQVTMKAAVFSGQAKA